MNSPEFNPRYLAYCRAQGLTPAETMTRDEQVWPGGKMCGFILWSSAALEECRREHPEYFMDGHLLQHKAYDAWLDSWTRVQ
jgi:hypothetical protein